MITKFAIPSIAPGGGAAKLDNALNCSVFTIVDFDANKKVLNIEILSNNSSSENNLSPIKYLIENDVNILVINELDTRTYLECMFSNIEVYKSVGNTVADIIAAYQNNSLKHIGKEKCNHDH